MDEYALALLWCSHLAYFLNLVMCQYFFVAKFFIASEAFQGYLLLFGRLVPPE
jgi:hypothetical protein